MQFFVPENLTFLWTVPAAFLLLVFSHKLWRGKLHRLIQDKNLLSKLMTGYRAQEWFLRGSLLLVVFLCCALALARPQWGDEKKKIHRKGIDIVFLVDASLSMLAEDIKPNRLQKAKFEIETFIQNLQGDRVGMVTFSGSGFIQAPLTLDHAAFLLFLDAVQVGFLPDPGTSLAQAIHLALQAFPQKEMKYKAIVLFTDGEDHEGGIDKAIEEARKANVRIYTIGLGTVEGEPIPLKNEKGERVGFKKDGAGQVVVSKLNQALLERLAKETQGIYLPGSPSEKEVDLILKHMKSWGEQQFAEKEIVEKEDQYQIFLIIALLCLIAEMLVRRANQDLSRLAVCFLAFFVLTGFLESSSDLIEKGNEHFKNKRYQSALDAYRKVEIKKPDIPEVRYDLGTALYKMDQFQESGQQLEEAVKLSPKNSPLLAQALYNYGNAQYRLGNFEAAIDAYKKALRINPEDKDAKYNLEFLQKEKNKFEKKDQERKKDNPQKQPQQQQPKQQQQQQNQGGQGQGQQQQQNQQQNQQQKDQESQDQKQQQSQSQKDQEKEEKQQQQQDQKDQKGQQDQKDQQDPKTQNKDNQEQNQEPRDQDQEEENQPKEQNDQEKRQGRRPLQGQMSMDNALNLLDALKESEKELQDLRRPPVDKNPPRVEKDW